MTRNADQVAPYPRRYRWLKRLSLVVLLVAVGVLALRGWWGYTVDRQLQERVNLYHQRGEPILLEDFKCDPIPDSRNAAYYYKQAYSAITLSSQQQGYYDQQLPGKLPWSKADMDFMRNIVQANAQVYPLVRQAQNRPDADWGIRLTRPTINVLLPNLSPSRKLATLLKNTAFHDHQAGDDASAMEHLRELRHLSAMVQRPPVVLVTQLVGIGINAMANQAILDIAPTLNISDASMRAKVKSLIAELLNEEQHRRQIQDTWIDERLFCVDMYFEWAEKQYFLRPMLRRDAMNAMDYFDALQQAAQKADFPAAKAALPTFPRGKSLVQNLSRLMSQIMLPACERAIFVDFKQQTDSRAAAIMLALRLYAIDHHGALPAKLDELTPQYLPAIPLDPMAAGGLPFHYIPGGKRPILYSVGEDGFDNGGSEINVRNPKVAPTQRWDMQDWVYPLIPTVAPTTQSVKTGVN